MAGQAPRLALLHHLVERLGTHSRIKIQNMSYLLREGLDVKTDHYFKMQHRVVRVPTS